MLMRHAHRRVALILTLAGVLAAASPGAAQVPGSTGSARAPGVPPQELVALVAPVALYPDELLAVVLRASTQPVQIVQAARFLEKYAKDKSLKPNPSWSEPVKILVNYPEVIRKMNDDLDWTEQLGGAVKAQQADVLAAVQNFRRRAATAGNLRSDDKQVVTQEGGNVAIVAADPQVIHVPVYDPAMIVVVQPTPSMTVYVPTPYPAYYNPYPAGAAATGFFFGALTTAWVMDWDNWNIDEDDLEDFQEKRQQSLSQRQQSRQDAASQRQQARQDTSTQRQQARQDSTAQRQASRQESLQGRQPTQVPAGVGSQQDLRAALGGDRPAQMATQGGFQQRDFGDVQRPGYQPPGGFQPRPDGDAFNYGSGRGAVQAGDRGAQSRNIGGGQRQFSGGGRGRR